MNKLIEELLKKGISISSVSLIDDCLSYEIEGFYKSGTIFLYKQDEIIWAKSRYDEPIDIKSFEDLVLLNYTWWNYSKNRYEGWTNPNSAWLPHFIEMGLVNKKEEIKVTYE